MAGASKKTYGLIANSINFALRHHQRVDGAVPTGFAHTVISNIADALATDNAAFKRVTFYRAVLSGLSGIGTKETWEAPHFDKRK